MFKYKQTKEHRKKIGLANAINMKEYWNTHKPTKKQLEVLCNSAKKRKEKYGYINSPEVRRKLSKSISKMWKENRVTEKQKQTLFKEGIDNRRVNTQFKEGHEVSNSTREAVKESRAKQIFPKKDSLIEIKIQNLLKQLKINFITHQYMNMIEHKYQCDIFIPSRNMIIECDGQYWHKYPIGNEIDIIRNRELREKGFRVLRLWEPEIKAIELNEFNQLLERLNGS
jgi:very-short-patch-repair endonuclease